MPAWGICKCHRQQLLEKHSLEKAGNQWCGDVPPTGHVQACYWNKTSDGCCSHRHPRSKTSDLSLDFRTFFFDNTILIYWWITVPYWTFVSNCFVNKTNNKLPRRQQVPTWWRSASAGSFQELRWTALHWWMGLVTMHSQHWLHWRRGFLFMALVICCQNPIHILCLELVGITPIQQQWMQHRKLYPKDVHNPQQSMSQARFQTHAVYAQVGLGLCHLKTSCDRNL